MTERILILNVSGIGDFVDSTPAIRHIRKLRPNASLTLAVAEKTWPLARGCHYVNEVIALPTSAGRSVPAIRDLGRWSRHVFPLFRRFDTAINFYNIASRGGALWIRFLLGWSGARLTIGSNIGGHAPFYTRAVQAQKTFDQLDSGMRVAALLDPSQTMPAANVPELWIARDVMERTQARVQSLANGGSKAVSIFLGGDRRTRHEDPERAAKWLGRIQDRWSIHPIVIGAASDPGLPATTSIRHTDMRGKATIEETAAVIASSSALITTHSAPQHFASVWEIPTVVLAGPGDITRYRPHLPSNKLRIVKREVECAPCYYAECPLTGDQHQKCMSEIPADSVVQAFSEVI